MYRTQRKILNLITPNGIGAVTLREIGELIGITHPQKVKYHLDQLEIAGLISVGRENGRIVSVVSKIESSPDLASIPIYGSADCGPATLLAEENFEGCLRVSRKFLLTEPKKLFVLKAVGPSMNRAKIRGASIENDDYVIVDSNQKVPITGDYVVSVIDGCANIKKFIREDNRIVLVSESESKEDFPPIFIHENDDFLINGKVVQVIKKPKGGEKNGKSSKERS